MKIKTITLTAPEKWKLSDEEKVQYFKFSINANSFIVKETLWVYIDPTSISSASKKHTKNTNITAFVRVYEVKKMKKMNFPQLITLKTEKLKIDSRKGSWIQIDLMNVVSSWIRHPKSNYGLVIHSYDMNGNSLNVSSPYTNDFTKNTFIEIITENKKDIRNKRDTGLTCDENSNELRCCLHPLTIDFDELGWNWIIEPRKYKANYCSGDCSSTTKSIGALSHLMKQADVANGSGPCCISRKLSSISMLYLKEDNNVLYGTLPGMRVEECGCS